MNRRSFFTLLATLAAWVSMRPKLHADAVNASFKPAIEPNQLIVRLWDGLTLVKEYQNPVQAFGARWVVPVRVPRNTVVAELKGPPWAQYRETTFLRGHTAVDAHVAHRPVMYVHYEYESGPKWWATPKVRVLLFDGDVCIKSETCAPPFGMRRVYPFMPGDPVIFRPVAVKNGSTIHFGKLKGRP